MTLVLADHRYRVRLDRIAATLFTLGVMVFLGVAGVSPSGAGQAPAEPITVVVQHGDTLWDLADHRPVGVTRMEYVNLLEEVNGVRAGSITPGRQLTLPRSAHLDG